MGGPYIGKADLESEDLDSNLDFAALGCVALGNMLNNMHERPYPVRVDSMLTTRGLHNIDPDSGMEIKLIVKMQGMGTR
jgi:hypothetical protein